VKRLGKAVLAQQLRILRQGLERIRKGDFCTPNKAGNGCAGPNRCAGHIAACTLQKASEVAHG
jgi:hypothetical protein